jgi:hypothetical protein
MSKKKTGRPTNYKPEYCQMIIESMSKGTSVTAFAAEIGVVKDTLYEWAKVYPDFSDSMKQAMQICEKWWEARGMKGMTEGSQKFNANIWMFFMKNRFKWSDRTETTQVVEISEKDLDEVKEAIKRLEE